MEYQRLPHKAKIAEELAQKTRTWYLIKLGLDRLMTRRRELLTPGSSGIISERRLLLDTIFFVIILFDIIQDNSGQPFIQDHDPLAILPTLADRVKQLVAEFPPIHQQLVDVSPCLESLWQFDMAKLVWEVKSGAPKGRAERNGGHCSGSKPHSLPRSSR